MLLEWTYKKESKNINLNDQILYIKYQLDPIQLSYNTGDNNKKVKFKRTLEIKFGILKLSSRNLKLYIWIKINVNIINILVINLKILNV